MDSAKKTDELQQQRGDAVLWLKLNRPQALNSLTLSLVEALTAAIKDAENDPDVRVIVLTGEGRAFCAGADLKDPARSRPGKRRRVCQGDWGADGADRSQPQAGHRSD